MRMMRISAQEPSAIKDAWKDMRTARTGRIVPERRNLHLALVGGAHVLATATKRMKKISTILMEIDKVHLMTGGTLTETQ